MPPGQEEKVARLERLKIHRRNLQHYLKQQAYFTEAYIPPVIKHGIDDARREIRHIKTQLREWGVSVEDLEDDEPKITNRPAILAGPHQVPQPLRHYVERQDVHSQQTIEQTLHNFLLAEGKHLTILHGMSGTGKSSLAVHVVRRLDSTDFPDGILWGDLANHTPGDQLLIFLGLFKGHQHRGELRENLALRDIFWQTLAEKRVLIVLDNVKEARQLLALLPPDFMSLGQCHLLVISLQPFYDVPLPPADFVKIGPLSDTESLTLFEKHLDPEQFKLYKDKLREIAYRLEHLPQLLTAAARDFASGRVSPNTYVNKLYHDRNHHILSNNAILEGLELALCDLPAEQMDLIKLIGVLGEGDWQDAMLAAIALLSLDDLRQKLTAFVDRELIKAVGKDRYRVNSLVREFAQRRFRQQSEYQCNAAYRLLAHYCLDLGQDLEASLLTRPAIRHGSAQPGNRLDERFIEAFRDGLLPEMSHIREVLQWAIWREAWDILRRFSYLSYMELLKYFTTNGFEIQMSLSMVTMLEPIVWRHGEKLQIEIASLITSTGWILCSPSGNGEALDQGVAAANFTLVEPRPNSPTENCEFRLDITIGKIIDGVFDTMSLVTVNWTGVRAISLICRNVDIVGGHFIACDMSQSVWSDCDAREVTMLGTNLSYGLFRNVKLRRAKLQGSIFIGAVLEEVDLREADLRGVNLAGARLLKVDLRGADLCGANLSATEVRHVNLTGCRLEQVHWSGADVAELIGDSITLKEIEQATKVQPGDNPVGISRRTRLVQEFENQEKLDGRNADLRAAFLAGMDLTDTELSGADLRAATFFIEIGQDNRPTGANLENATLDWADMRATLLTRTRLTGASMKRTDLRAAILQEALLEKADLSNAVLRRAYIERAILRGAILNDADLEGAVLCSADLSEASLIRTNLTHANMQDVQFQRAYLQEVRLDHTKLDKSDLTHANIQTNSHQTTFREATFIAAKLNGTFTEVDFTSAILQNASLSGTFDSVKLRSTDLRNAHLSGIYSRVDFSAADLRDAHLEGADLVNSDLTKALVSEQQLRQANRLRGTLLSDGTRYHGRFNLPGDLEDARNMGYDLDNPDDFEEFYVSPRVRYRGFE